MARNEDPRWKQPCPAENCTNCAVHESSVFAKVGVGPALKASGLRTSRAFRRGDVLFSRGERACVLYCIRSGVVKLVIPGRPGGRDQLVRLLGPGAFVGQSALHGGVHHLTAKVVEDTRICAFPVAGFSELRSESAELSGELGARVWGDLRAHEENQARMAGSSVRERVALTLLNLHRQFGVRVPEGILINVRLSRGDVASLAGTVLESAVRHLSEFRSEGLISTAGRKLVVVRADALAQVAGSRTA